MGSQIFLPEVSYVSFDQTFKAFLAWWFTEQFERMGQVIFKAESSNIREPILATLARDGQETVGYGVQDVTRQAANHAKESELLEVQCSLPRKAASKKEDYWFRSFGMKFQ